MSEMTPEQLRSVARHILRSWKFWGCLVLVVAAAGLGIVALAQRIIDLRSADYLKSIQEKASGQLAGISGQISNQIAFEFNQPRIQSAIDRVARDRAAELLTNAVWPSLEAFQIAVDQARSKLTRSSNQLAFLENQIRSASLRMTNASNPSVAKNLQPSSPAPPASPGSTKLALVDHAVSMHGNNYLLTLNLKKPGGMPIGVIELVAGTYKQTAKILGFSCAAPDQSPAPVFNTEGDAADLTYFASGDETTILIELSGPTIVRVSGDALEGDLTLPVAADKIKLAPASAGP